MSRQKLLRKLAAILVADAVGYSRLMGADELGTYAQFKSDLRKLIRPKVAANGGRIIKTTGDGFLAEFASVVDAVRCADELQRLIERRNSGSPGKQRLAYRMGINLGDIIVEADDIYGDDVNIAVRIEGLAEPGGVTLASEAYRSVRKKLPLEFEDLGEHQLKNITEPVRVYRLRKEAGDSRSVVAGDALEGRPVPSDAPSRASDSPLGRYLPYKPTIAVLPFRNLSGDPGQDYFCDGLTQDITTDLSKFANLFVIAPHSAFMYKGRVGETEEVSRQLGVRYLLEGSVQRTSDRVRINAQLIDADTSRHMWAERFDRPLDNLFAVQDEIIQMIVVALALKVDAAERERALRKEPVNMSAYDLYLKGIHVFSWETEEELKRSHDLFEKATRLDPSFARAWGWLAYTCVRGVLAGWQGAEALEQAEAFARRAVNLDPYDYASHWDLAFVYLNSRRFDHALSEYRRALLLNPNDADLLADTAEMLMYAGETTKAIEQIKHAMRINPYFPDWYRWNLGWAYYNARQYDDALSEFGQMFRPSADVYLFSAASYAQKGDTTAAAAALKRFLAQKETRYTICDIKKRGCFKNPADEEHWLEGLRKAGLPEN